MSEHIGYDKHEPVGRNRGNSRNGKRSKTLLTSSSGDVEVDMPRDREGSFEPVIVRKRQRRVSDVDEIVLSLYAKGLTTGEISAHFEQIYGASVSRDTVSRITDRVIEEMQAWSGRPLETVYAAIFIDAIMVKVRDGQVGNRPVYAAIGVDLDGHKDILGMWAGDGDGESTRFWMAVLTDLKNRGVADVFFVVCDGLKGLPDSVNAVWPMATVQTCIIHLIRGTFRYASRKYWDELSKDLKPIYQAATPDTAAGAGRLGRQVGQAVPRDDQTLASRLERVHPVPGLRRRNQTGDLLDQRHRYLNSALPACGQGTRTLPDRTGRNEVPVPGDAITGPQRHRSDTMGIEVETSAERVRHHLRRPHAGRRGPITMKTPLTPLAGQTP